MRITLSSTALSAKLNMLSRVINSKNSMPILDCFLFQVHGDTLTVTASDSENVMQCHMQLDEADGDGEFCLNNRNILDAVKELPEQPLTLDVDLEAMTIKVIYQNGLYNFNTQNAEEYPRLEAVNENITNITIDAGVLVDTITRTLFATGNDDLRPVMNGIYFDLTTDFLTIVATDGHKLVRNREMNIKGENPASFILPKKPATLIKNGLDRNAGEVTIRFNQEKAEIIYADGLLSCRLIEGRYPNYNSVIPQDNPNKVTIDRKSFFSALRRVLPFASESTQSVRLHLESGKMELTAEDIDFATSAREQLICDYSGQPMEIGFKGSTLLEVMNTLTSDNIVMALADPSRAGVITPETQPENEDILMLVMPMLLND
ncbi:DNA polymerase III subunit beta [Prevotella sp. AGR2160]|uniref:DNA polymerase III subunit beta n=1 Tax=Prevotella sp. AGR2160 TaxID=1280674 RepID=UPI0004918393|nr:DNA polymerase III subunit beta [Prevotella sp. AGR2160]